MSPRTTNTNSKKWSTACGITFLFLLGCSVSRWLDVSWDAPFDQSRLLLLLNNNFTVDSNSTAHHFVHLEATVTSEALLLRRRRRPSNNYTRINSNNRTEDPANSTATIRNNNNNNNKRQQRILYTITTLKEYNDGTRSTHKDSDRYQDTLIPIVVQGVQSMLDYDGYYHYYYDVDVYLICAFVLTPERQQLLRDKLPSRVGLEVWDDALPLAYSVKDMRKNSSTATLTNHSRGLARQHRLVLKDKLLHYDVFVNFEDDMLVKGEHVQNYVAMTNHLQALRTQAPREDDDALNDLHTNNITASSLITHNPLLRYFGTMTQRQLSQIIPGFIRVEVVLNETQTPIPPLSVKVPVDLDHIVPSSSDAFQDNNHPHYHHRNYFRKSSAATSRILPANSLPLPEDLVDPSPCCHASPNVTTTELLVQPSLHQLMVWETQIVALGVRQMPSLLLGNHTTTYNNESYPLDWVVLQRGTPSHQGIPDYWSGNTGYYQNDTVHWRPDASERKYINNMGGYMATQQQLLEWHLDTCPSGFLPPFDGSSYGDMDGLDLRDVEFWSGGIQLISQCGLTRAINLDPRYFGRHLLYHTANNKQVQLQHVKERFTRADELYGMLTTTRKHAERTQERLWQNATTDHNVTHCIQESPHCFPPSNRKGKCNIETAMACLLPLGNESIPENASV